MMAGTLSSADANTPQCKTRPSISAKELEDGRARWKTAGLECPADACFSWVSCKKPPLYWEPLYSKSPIETKLANITAALDAGADPNELDHELNIHRGLGRPLHCCIGGHGAWGPSEVVRLNVPLIELLLSRGADPRLEGPGRPPWQKPSPLELVRQEAQNPNPDDTEKILQDCGFYSKALELLQSAADSLNERDNAIVHQDGVEKEQTNGPDKGSGCQIM